MRIVEYDPERRADVAALLGRVWGTSPREDVLAWLYERNPVRPASVLLGEDEGRVVGLVAISFVRLALDGAELEVGMPIHLATDPAARGRGIFSELQTANEERARQLGIGLLLIVPNAASAGILTGRLGWKPLGPLRLWARAKLRGGHPRALPIARFERLEPSAGSGGSVVRDAAWLNWRFVDSPTPYQRLAAGGDAAHGYAVSGRKGRLGVVAAVEGPLVRDAVAAAGGPVVVASPPPGEHVRYLSAGFLPTHRRLTVLGKALDPAVRVPERPHFELGDLDFV